MANSHGATSYNDRHSEPIATHDNPSSDNIHCAQPNRINSSRDGLQADTCETRTNGLINSSETSGVRNSDIAGRPDRATNKGLPPTSRGGGEYTGLSNPIKTNIQTDTGGNDRQPQLDPTAQYRTMDILDFRKVNDNNIELRNIFDTVARSGTFNYMGVRLRLPSGLNISQRCMLLRGYRDDAIVDYLEFGWPIGIDRTATLHSDDNNHPSTRGFPADVEHYVVTELGHKALLGPFDAPPPPPPPPRQAVTLVRS